MFHPVMEGMGYATNVNETGVQYLNVNTRKFEQKVAIFDSNYKCGGTHGVDYSPINNKIYAECSNPTKCVSPYKDPALCTGSLWTVNAATAASEARLTSPTLSAALGANFGIQGQPYHTPDSKYMFVPNKNLDILHILQPTATTTNIIEVTLPAPGNIVFFPKNSNIEYGTDSDSGNYVMAIAYKGGVAFLEMSVVVSAFEKGSLTLSEDVFTKVLTVTSDKTRTIMRGNDYVLIQEYPTLTTTDRLAVISYKTKTIESYVSVANSLKMAFVPIQTGQLKAQVAEMQAIISSSSGTTTTAASSEFTKAAFILAIIAIVLSVITLLAVSLLFTSRKRDNIKKEMESTAKTLEKA